MRRLLQTSVVALSTLAFAGSAGAAVAFDQNLASPNGGTTPGWYNGTGNPNGGFTVSTNNGVELALRAKMRGSASVIHTSNNVYEVQPGVSTAPRAWWNYEFSMNTRAGGVGTRTLADTVFELKITDLTFGGSATVNPLTYWTDDTGVNAVGTHSPQVPTDFGAQNSENPQFADYPLGAGFDVNAYRVVQFDLTARDATSQAVLATDQMFVVVPEPASASIVLGGLSLLGLRRRRA